MNINLDYNEYYTIRLFDLLTHPIAKKLWFMTLFDYYAIVEKTNLVKLRCIGYYKSKENDLKDEGLVSMLSVRAITYPDP